MIKWKIDSVTQALKEKGYNTYIIQKNRIMSGDALVKLTHMDTNITMKLLNTVCAMLDCQPGDLIEFVPDESDLKYRLPEPEQ